MNYKYRLDNVQRNTKSQLLTQAEITDELQIQVRQCTVKPVLTEPFWDQLLCLEQTGDLYRLKLQRIPKLGLFF
jgi:hypothetical protein